jgi:predicted N-acetyltransferase YhbS
VSITADAISIRPIGPDDDVAALTDLLHRAYSALGARGWNYTAVDQTSEVTRKRIAGGVCLVAADADGRIVGTALFKAPGQELGSPWLRRPEVAHIGQLAVEPALQTRGLGGRLMAAVEETARVSGARELALDTAEPAVHLIDWYTRRGYRFIEHAQWRGKRYRSVIMSKAL